MRAGSGGIVCATVEHWGHSTKLSKGKEQKLGKTMATFLIRFFQSCIRAVRIYQLYLTNARQIKDQ